MNEQLKDNLYLADLSDYEYVFDAMKKAGERTCFICENEGTANTVVSAGGAAVITDSTGNGLFEYLDERHPHCMFAVCIDNHNGKADEMANRLYDARYLSTLALPAGEPKKVIAAATARLNDAAQRAMKATANGGYIIPFYESICNGGYKTEHFATGLPKLDALLNGGLTAGLYVLGAASSTGKTTLCLQWADNIAAAGQNVLYISAEMSRDELMARSLSRQSYLRQPKQACTEEEVLDGKFLQDGEKSANMAQALTLLNETEKHLFVDEYDGTPSVASIEWQMENIAMLSGQMPIVIIDYLQLMLPADKDKRAAMDKIIMQLKQLSRKHKIPVLAISSINRSSYKDNNLKSAYKESGTIEYSADVLINYNYRVKYAKNNHKQAAAEIGKDVAGYTDAEEMKAAMKSIRKMTLAVSKNRRGQLGEVYLDYNSKYNILTESTKQPIPPNAADYDTTDEDEEDEMPF